MGKTKHAELRDRQGYVLYINFQKRSKKEKKDDFE